MEQKYGLSPRGGKPVTKDTGNGLHSPGFEYIKGISSSHEDLSRSDRHQPIIIQNFELLTPNQLKLRRRSLSTANLFLSQASLTRSGGFSMAPDQRPATADPGNSHSNIPILTNKSDSKIYNNHVRSNGDLRPPSPLPSSSITPKKHGTQKTKRVTFSAKNTLHPYEPEQQSVGMNSVYSVSEIEKYRKSLRYSSKRDASRQFLPFQNTFTSERDNNLFHYDKNISSNKNRKYNDMPYDVTAYNGEWVPKESLASRSRPNSTNSRLPLRSSLKQTLATNKGKVKQSHSHDDDHWSSGRFEDTIGQLDTYFSDHSTPKKMTEGGQESIYKPATNSHLVSINTVNNDGVLFLSNPGINSSCFKDDIRITMKNSGETGKTNSENIVLPVKEDPISNGIPNDTWFNNNDLNNDDTDENKNHDISEASLDVDSEGAGDAFARDFTDPNKKSDNDSNSNSNTDGQSIEEYSKVANNNNDHATTFFDIFSTYDVADNEYSTHNGQSKMQSDNKSVKTSEIAAVPSNESKITDNNSVLATKSTSVTSNADQKSESAFSSDVSSTPNVIRLKFLEDSDKQHDKKMNNANGPRNNSRTEVDPNTKRPFSQRSVSIDNDLPISAHQTSPNTTALYYSNSPSAARQLKTKSTIEAVDLSSLVPNFNDPSRSQSDTHAQFLMNMYSASGDRKTAEELEGAVDNRPPSRKPTDKIVSVSAEDEVACSVKYRDPLASSSRGRQKEKQLLSSSRSNQRTQSSSSRPLLQRRSTSANAMMVTGTRMVGKERVVAAEKYLLKTGYPKESDRTALNRQLEQLIVSRSVSARVRLTMERSKSNLM